MSPRPNGPGSRGAGAGKNAGRSDAAWFAELDQAGDDQDGWRGVVARVRRVRPGRHAKRALGALAVVAVLGIGAKLLYKGPTDCRRTAERQRAYRAVRTQRDNVAGEEIGRRFRGEPFRCADIVSPAGVLVSVKEETGDAIIWFVDGGGEAHNVNLLAKAWTPALTPAPTLPADALQRIRE